MKKERKEKIKIISEKVRSEFKELENQEDDEALEEMKEEFDEGFEDSELGDRAAPVLQTSNQQQTIEEQLADVPSAKPKEEGKERIYEEAKVYNMPDRTSSYETEREVAEKFKSKDMQDSLLRKDSLNLRQSDQNFRQPWIQDQPIVDETKQYRNIKPAEQEERRMPGRRDTRRRI